VPIFKILQDFLNIPEISFEMEMQRTDYMNGSPKERVLNEPDLRKDFCPSREIVGMNAERWYWQMQIVCDSL
jgi:hypothetical protein